MQAAQLLLLGLVMRHGAGCSGSSLSRQRSSCWRFWRSLKARVSLSAHHRPSLSDLFDKTSGKIRTIVWVGVGLAVFQQLVGINVVFYYGAVLWQAVGFSEADALKINILGGSISILSCLVAIGLIDRIGRKPLLLIGSAGMAVTLGIMSIAFMSGSLVDGTLELSDGAGLAALIAANAYVAFFNFSWGPVMWVMLGYALSAAISVIFVWVMVKETKGMELEDMQG